MRTRGGQQFQGFGREGGTGCAHHLPAEPTGDAAQCWGGGARVGGVVQQQWVDSGGGCGGQPRRRQTGGVQTSAAERLQAGGVVYGFVGDGGFDTAGVRVAASGETAVGQQEQGCAAHG